MFFGKLFLLKNALRYTLDYQSWRRYEHVIVVPVNNHKIQIHKFYHNEGIKSHVI
jgi:hypothetical protein